MFTGLVESTGSVIRLQPIGDQARLTLLMPFRDELTLGESVAVNGCCLTVADVTADGVSFDLLAQTLSITSLGSLQAGDIVNLERALRAGDRLGGHFVQGHVDTTGTILRLSREGQDHCLEVSLPPQIHRLCIDKGSLCVDGISLTIADLLPDRARFWITPHTFAVTHLPHRQTGQSVNLEADLLAKHVAHLVAGFTAKPAT